MVINSSRRSPLALVGAALLAAGLLGSVAVRAYSIATNAAGTKSKSQTKTGYPNQSLQIVLVLVH